MLLALPLLLNLTFKTELMNPTTDIKGEHTAITIILEAMKKLARDLRQGKFVDSYRIVQILDFLNTFAVHNHYAKEEKCLYPAMLECEIGWTADTITHLLNEHELAQEYISEIDRLFQEYLSGNAQVADALSVCMLNYVHLEERHIKIVNNVILPLCDIIFSVSQLTSISADLKKIQDRTVGHLKHQEYYQLLSMLYSESGVLSESISE
jgi:hemerythrin-like domain-containing protein